MYGYLMGRPTGFSALSAIVVIGLLLFKKEFAKIKKLCNFFVLRMPKLRTCVRRREYHNNSVSCCSPGLYVKLGATVQNCQLDKNAMRFNFL